MKCLIKINQVFFLSFEPADLTYFNVEFIGCDCFFFEILFSRTELSNLSQRNPLFALKRRLMNGILFILDGNLETMSSTPQKGFSTATWNKIQRDLNSPSASCRLKAIRAIK